MSRNASSRVCTPASAVCASISRMRYGFAAISAAIAAWVKASIVQLKLLTHSRNRLSCCFAIATALRIWFAKCHDVGPSPTGARQSAGMVTTPMLASFLPTDCDASGENAL
jgi:hypothetical protein